jgi:hypothetical protein
MAAVSLCPIRLAAHQNLSNARIELKPDRTVGLEIALKGGDVDRVAGTKVFDPQSDLSTPRGLPPPPRQSPRM